MGAVGMVRTGLLVNWRFGRATVFYEIFLREPVEGKAQ
jgi:hypothetical protein